MSTNVRPAPTSLHCHVCTHELGRDCDGKGGIISSTTGDAPPSAPPSTATPSTNPSTSSGSSSGSMVLPDMADMMGGMMKNSMRTLFEGGMCVEPTQATKIKEMLEPMECLGNAAKDDCNADAKCAWAEMVCLPMAQAKTMKAAYDKTRGIGMGDTVFKCMAAEDEAACTTAGTDCKYVTMGTTGMGQCMDSASATRATAAMQCASKSKDECAKDTKCGYAGMPGMPEGFGTCIDEDNAKMLNDAAGEVGDMLDNLGSTMSDAAKAAAKAAAKTAKEAAKKLRPSFGCFGMDAETDCIKDTTCSWFKAPIVAAGAAVQTLAGMADHCVEKKMLKMLTCTTKLEKAACASDATCSWANVGATMGMALEACVSSAEAAMIAKAAADFTKGSKDLKSLGGSINAATNTLLNQFDANDFTGFDKLKDADVISVIGSVAAKIKKGEGSMTKDAAKKMLDKAMGAGGWGAIKDWTEDKFEDAGALLDGLDVASIIDIPDGTFEKVMDNFGAVHTWGKGQEKELAGKFRKTIGDFTNCTAAGLDKIKGFIPGLTAAELANIPKDAFKDAAKSIAESCQKIGAFAEDQLEAMEKQVKDAFGDAAGFTEDMVEDMGGMIGALDAEDLKKMTKKAKKKIKRAAIKMMGGKKAGKAFAKETLKEFSAEAKKAFNGADLAALRDEAIDKMKAVVCNPTCPGAITDITIAHDGSSSDDELLAKCKKALEKVGEAAADNLEVLQAATPMSTTTRRRLLKQGRLLAESTASQQTVVRTTTSSNQAAADAAAAGNTVAGATSTTVAVDATDGGPGMNQKDVKTAGAGMATPSLLAAAVVAAAALFM